MRRTLRIVLVATVASTIGVLGFAGTAQAHVTVNPNQATAGGYTRVAFRVPTESANASTTKLDVYLPTEHPITSVSIMPVPGWTGELVTGPLPTPVTDQQGNKITKAVTRITWTANSADTAIHPGQFQEFPVSFGPLPSVDSLTFKVIQTYSDGSVVRWIDESTSGQAEPEHPAPVLKLTAKGATAGGATAGDATAGDAAAGDAAASAAPRVAATGGDGTASTALDFGIAGLVAGLIGLVLGGFAIARTRRRQPTP